jgi:hypothetical protein
MQRLSIRVIRICVCDCISRLLSTEMSNSVTSADTHTSLTQLCGGYFCGLSILGQSAGALYEEINKLQASGSLSQLRQNVTEVIYSQLKR